MIEQFGEFIPALTALALAGLALFISHWWFLGRHSEYGAESRLPGQLTLALLGLVAVLAVLLTLPLLPPLLQVYPARASGRQSPQPLLLVPTSPLLCLGSKVSTLLVRKS